MFCVLIVHIYSILNVYCVVFKSEAHKKCTSQEKRFTVSFERLPPDDQISINKLKM